MHCIVLFCISFVSLKLYKDSELDSILVCCFSYATFALVLSRLDYCNNVLFALPANLIQCLQSVQNAVARLIFRI